MKIGRSLLPVFIALAITCGVLFLLEPRVTRADIVTLIQTTVEDFNLGSFYRTGMTRDSDGEVTLLSSGIAGEWLTNINQTGFVPRYGHAAIVYNNRIYVLGGRTSTGSLRSIQYAQINTQTHNLSNWITSSVSLPTSIYTYTTGSRSGVTYLSAVQLHGRVYLLGGENGDQAHRYSVVSFAALNATTGELGTLIETAPLPKPLSEGQAIAMNNRIYFLGGRTGEFNRGTNDVYYAEPLTTTGVITAWFTATLPLPYPPYGHMAIGTNEGRLYAMAGVSYTSIISGSVIPDVYYAEPLTATGNITGWQTTLNLPRNIFAGSAVYFGGQIYAIGGALDGIATPSELAFSAFDEPTGGVVTWTATSVITPARIAATALINSDGWIYVVGGASGFGDPIQSSIINAGATTGNAGTAYAKSGTFRSAELDLIKNYQVNSLSWQAFLSNASEMTLTVRYRYRSSFGAYSDWSAYHPSNPTPGIATTVISLGVSARYVQYEVFFSTTNPITTPIFYQMMVTYERPEPPLFNKSANPPNGSTVKSGDRITYTIWFTNTTGLTHTQLNMQDTVPEGTHYVPNSIFASSGITPNDTFLPYLNWDVGTLNPGAGRFVGFAVTVDSGLVEGTRINNAATFDSASLQIGSNRVTHIAGIPPRLIKTHDVLTWGSVQPNELITYTLTYSNPPGSAALSNVIISDTLPKEVFFVNGTPAPNVTSVGGDIVISWNLPSVPANGTGLVRYTVGVNAPAQVPDGTLIQNTARMSAEARSTVSSNTDSVKVRYRYDLEMRFKVDKTRAPQGSLLTYTYYFTNMTQMPITLTGITAYAYLKSGLPGLTRTHVLNCATPCSSWNYNGLEEGALVYSKTLPALGPNRSASTTLVAQISPTLPLEVLAVDNSGDAGNEAEEGMEINGANQTGEEITTVNGPDIVIQRLQAPAHGITNKNLKVAVTLFNNGFVATKGPDNTGWFGIDLYLKPYGAPPPDGPHDRYLGACPTTVNPCPGEVRYNQYLAIGYPNGELSVDQIVTVTFPLTVATPGRYWLYTQADTFWNDLPSVYGTLKHGRVIEGNEKNNILGPIEIVIDYPKVYLPLIRR